MKRISHKNFQTAIEVWYFADFKFKIEDVKLIISDIPNKISAYCDKCVNCDKKSITEDNEKVITQIKEMNENLSNNSEKMTQTIKSLKEISIKVDSITI